MDTQLINTYQTIRALTYDNVEIHLMAGLKQHLPKAMTFKDLTVMYFINQQVESNQNTALEIAKALSMQKNTFSNRLNRLEKAGLIIKKEVPEDLRKVKIELSPSGHQTLNQYTEIVNGFTTYLKKAIPPRERFKLAQAMVKGSNAMTSQTPIKISRLQPRKLKTQLRDVLSRFYDDVVKEEEHHLEKRNLPLSIFELRVLVEITTHPSPVTQKEITQTFKVTQSTLMSMMMRLEKNGWITKTQDPNDHRVYHLNLSSKGYTESELFINHRIQTRHKIIEHLTPQEETLIYKAFQTLKSYAETL